MWFTWSHDLVILKFIELGLLVYVVYKVWEDNYGCAKQYRCDLDIYIINVLSYLYEIVMDRAINSPRHEKKYYWWV